MITNPQVGTRVWLDKITQWGDIISKLDLSSNILFTNKQTCQIFQKGIIMISCNCMFVKIKILLHSGFHSITHVYDNLTLIMKKAINK